MLLHLFTIDDSRPPNLVFLLTTRDQTFTRRFLPQIHAHHESLKGFWINIPTLTPDAAAPFHHIH